MPQNEDILWEILDLMKGHTAAWTFKLADITTQDEVENGYIVQQLKSLLVLRYLPADIEDTIYFMKHRDYLYAHGRGIVAPEIAFSMTEKAIRVKENQELPEEEAKAFKESLWNIEPKFYGMGPNIPGWKKYFSRLRRRKK